jgi:hypothetical protein
VLERNDFKGLDLVAADHEIDEPKDVCSRRSVRCARSACQRGNQVQVQVKAKVSESMFVGANDRGRVV